MSCISLVVNALYTIFGRDKTKKDDIRIKNEK